MLQTMVDYLKNGEEKRREAEGSPPVYYVATDLNLRKVQPTSKQDLDFNGKVYRKLTPEYFAWLRSRMVLARIANQNSKLSDSDWDILRGRFNGLQEIAVNEFGNDTLNEAVSKLNPNTYAPPTSGNHKKIDVSENDLIFPGNQAYKFTQPVTHEALAKVNAIRDEAISKGWSEALLYQNQGRLKFPCGKDYGLVCFLDDECEIGEITGQSIEIIHGTRRSVLKFYNPDVEQPWIRKVQNGS